MNDGELNQVGTIYTCLFRRNGMQSTERKRKERKFPLGSVVGYSRSFSANAVDDPFRSVGEGKATLWIKSTIAKCKICPNILAFENFVASDVFCSPTLYLFHSLMNQEDCGSF
uniref:Uncharacterized protein n=1 Tax=Romanomermis culicivorax TaxID=13658 RepID=A0A915L2E5_ROMCU